MVGLTDRQKGIVYASLVFTHPNLIEMNGICVSRVEDFSPTVQEMKELCQLFAPSNVTQIEDPDPINSSLSGEPVRQQVRVRLDKDELVSLGIALSQMPQGGIKDVLTQFHRRAKSEFKDCAEEGLFIEAATSKFCGDDNINVDMDAPFSRADDAVWVGGWLRVTYEEMGIK